MAEDVSNGRTPAVSILPAPGQDEAVPVSSEEIREVILQVRDCASRVRGNGIKSSMQGSKPSAWVALVLVCTDRAAEVEEWGCWLCCVFLYVPKPRAMSA